jgi:type IV pilus biogenesis protein CpaD/CtpE
MAQRRATACDSVIRPAGRGRQGRLTLSSSQLRAWLDTLHKSRWNQIHIQHWTRLESDCTGAVAQANAVCEAGYQGVREKRLRIMMLTMGRKIVL